jgi:hypothetical protein
MGVWEYGSVGVRLSELRVPRRSRKRRRVGSFVDGGKGETANGSVGVGASVPS